MTYLRTSSRPAQQRTRALIFATIIIVVLLALVHFIFPNVISGTWTAIARPFWRIEFSAESGGLRSHSALLAENEELRRQLTATGARLDTIHFVELENTELKRMLGRTVSTSTQSSLLAAVLERPPFGPYDELIIDIGKDVGLTVGDKVYAPGKILIGNVGAVLGKTAKVILFSSPGSKYEVMIGPRHVPATAIGRGGGQYEAQVARDIAINEGDFVEVPSLMDLPFAAVTSVISDPAQPFETIMFAPAVNVYQLRWVLVEKQ
jgi:cell shape-determining protein MreC